jgi:hypothetical protein
LTYEEVLDSLRNKIVEVDDFHFLKYHAKNTYFIGGVTHPIIDAIATALQSIDNGSPGYANEMIDRICSYKGDNWDNYDQILSIFAEIAAAFRAIQIADKVDSKPIFMREPKALKNSKNPEFSSSTFGQKYCVEVKAPKIRSHQLGRKSGFQFVSRSDHWLKMAKDYSGNVILPKDNPIKDYLVSANQKFEVYKRINEHDYRILFIFWDDYIYEPMNALLHPLSGLFTENSFHRDESGKIIIFENVDCVILSRHLMYFQQILADKKPIDPIEHAFDLNTDLPLIFVQNPHGRELPLGFVEQFNAIPPHPMLGSEYQIADIIFWM